MTETITRDELKAKLAGGEAVTIIEALPEPCYRKAHLPGALLLPHDKANAPVLVLLPNRAAEIVVFRADLPCPSTTIAAERLTELGYSRVRDYAEGKQDWIDAGHPTERGLAARAA